MEINSHVYACAVQQNNWTALSVPYNRTWSSCNICIGTWKVNFRSARILQFYCKNQMFQVVCGKKAYKILLLVIKHAG